MTRRRALRPNTYGKPTVLTQAKRERFLTALKAGNRRSAAARYAGLKEQTVKEWIRRGRGDDLDRPPTPFFVQFVQEVEEAEAHAEVFAVAQNRVAMGRDPAAARWWLENRSPEWRARQLPPGDAPLPLAIQQTTQVLVLTESQARDFGLERVRELRQANGDDASADRERLARLVEDVPATAAEG